MAGYAQFIFSYLTRQAHQETIAFAPSDAAPWQPSQWKITHDAAGKVVVRAHDHKQKLTVIATAAWNGTETKDHAQTNPANPSTEQWVGIDEALRAVLAQGASTAPNPTIDAGAVTNPAPASTAGGAGKASGPTSILGWIGAGIVLVLIVVGLVFGNALLRKLGWVAEGSRANGEKCTVDSDCRSNECYRGTCQGAPTKVRGDRCDRDRDCKSNRCRRDICD